MRRLVGIHPLFQAVFAKVSTEPAHEIFESYQRQIDRLNCTNLKTEDKALRSHQIDEHHLREQEARHPRVSPKYRLKQAIGSK